MYNLMKWDWNIDIAPRVTPLGTLFENGLSTKSKFRRINIAKVSFPLKNRCLDKYDNGGLCFSCDLRLSIHLMFFFPL